MVGPEVIGIMEKQRPSLSMDYLADIGGPVILFSPNAETDGNDLKDMLSGNVKMETKTALTDQLFHCTMLKRGNVPVALIFQEEACLGYTLFEVKGKGDIRIGTPDTLLHLYYTLTIFGTKEKAYFQTSLDCLIQKVHRLLKGIRSNPTKLLPAFSLRCSGHQKGMATLLKEKAERTKKEKKKQQTKKSQKSQKSQTKKSQKSQKSQKNI
jgi:hypothetical protein